MKWRWLKINGTMIWGTDNLTREDLMRAKNGGYDCIIDLRDGTFFDADSNEWKKVPGDD